MKPVITSNQASLWNLLSKIGYKKTINGLGQLLIK
jgi:maleate cis-trans isomerase